MKYAQVRRGEEGERRSQANQEKLTEKLSQAAQRGESSSAEAKRAAEQLNQQLQTVAEAAKRSVQECAAALEARTAALKSEVREATQAAAKGDNDLRSLLESRMKGVEAESKQAAQAVATSLAGVAGNFRSELEETRKRLGEREPSQSCSLPSCWTKSCLSLHQIFLGKYWATLPWSDVLSKHAYPLTLHGAGSSSALHYMRHADG